MVNNNYLEGISDINKRINSKYLSSSGNTELKTRLFRILKYLPALQIGFVVSYKDNTSKVAQIALNVFLIKKELKRGVPQEKIIFNMSNYYNVYDTTGNVVRRYFKTWKDAYTFLCVMGRYDWSIKKN